MTDYNLLYQNVPLGGTALARIGTKDSGSLADVDQVRVTWRDNINVTLATLTRTISDVSGTDIHGQPCSITDPAGTGNYEARLKIVNDGSYAPTGAGLTFTMELYVKKGSAEDTQFFTFKVVPSTLTVSLAQVDIAGNVRRQMRLIEDKSVYGSEGQVGRTIFYLGKDIVYDIEAIYKNGSPIIRNTDYEWTTFRPYVKMLGMTPPAEDAHFLFRLKVGISDDVIQEYINEALSHVLSALYPHYQDDNLVSYPTIVALIGNRVKGRLDQELSDGPAMESARFRAGRDLVMQVEKDLAAIQNGAMDVLDAGYRSVTRAIGTLAGGIRGASEVKSRRQLIDMAQQWTSIYIELPPEREIPSPRRF